MVAADPSKSSSGISGKRCVSCGTDVAGKKRMKDSKGVYWCYDCGLKDQAKQQSGSTGSAMTITCPACNKLFPPIQATKQGNVYVCPDCARKKLASKPVMKNVKSPRIKSQKSARSSGDEAANKKKLLLLGSVVAAITVVFVMNHFGML